MVRKQKRKRKIENISAECMAKAVNLVINQHVSVRQAAKTMDILHHMMMLEVLNYSTLEHACCISYTASSKRLAIKVRGKLIIT